MPRRAAAPQNPEMMLRGRRGQDMVTRADAPEPEEKERIRGGGPEVEGKIRELVRRDTQARRARHADEAVQRAQLRARNYLRNRGPVARRNDQWVTEMTETQRRAQEEAGRAHFDWAEEHLIDDQEGVHDQVEALYNATHARLPGMDDTGVMR